MEHKMFTDVEVHELHSVTPVLPMRQPMRLKLKISIDLHQLAELIGTAFEDFEENRINEIFAKYDFKITDLKE